MEPFRGRTHLALRNVAPMCEKCDEIDQQIEHYRMLSRRITDQLTLSGIALLIERYEARKRELHPEQREEWKRPQ